MAEPGIELKPVTHITTGAVGRPGQRVFYLQARKDDELVTFVVEKQQVEALALGVEKFLEELAERLPGLPPASDYLNEYEMKLEEPLDPVFRAGQMGLGYDEENDLLVLVLREVQPEDADPEVGAAARLWATRSQMLALARYGADVSRRGRPSCGNCGQPIDPTGHFCPKSNGHKH